MNGTGTVLLQVRRQSGTNTVEVVHGGQGAAQGTQQAASRPATRCGSCATRRSSSRPRSDNVEEHLIVGSILAALVVLLFLTNLRSTIIAAVAIPTSIIATFGLIWYMGFTLNLMTMLALTLSVGIVIDDAIVVLENIYRFIEEKHDDQFRAAIDATQEIGLAVLATTLSLVAIFVPVGFMGGIVGQVHEELRPHDGVRDHGVAARQLHADADAVGALAESEAARGRRPRIEGLEGLPRIDVFYTRLLEWSMNHRAIVAGVAVLVLLSTVPLFSMANKNFMPQDDQSEFEINLRAPEGTSLEVDAT